MEEFDKAEGEAVQTVWALFKTDNLAAGTLADSVWLNELQAETRNWEGSLSTLDRVVQVASRHNAIALVAAAYQAKAIIYKEYLKDDEGAEKVLAEGETTLGAKQILLQD